MSAASVTVLPRRIPPNILVAEGDARTRCLVSDELRVWGFKVLEASSADEALTLLGAVRIDLLFWALDLPTGGSGPDGALHLRDRTASTTILVTSAEAEPQEKQSLGLFIRKPYRSSEVAELAARCLNWPHPPQA